MILRKNVSRKITFKLKYLRPWSELAKVLKGTLIGYVSKNLNPEFAKFTLILQNHANVASAIFAIGASATHVSSVFLKVLVKKLKNGDREQNS